jgi:predicted DNA-binding protein (MmcQ/YjbR family)
LNRSSDMAQTIQKAAETLRAFALSFPGAKEDFPWGERVVKVNKKVFAFMGKKDDFDEGLGLSVKLRHSGADALKLSFTKPAGYGMGKHGWVAVKLLPGDELPVELLKQWIEESYRAVAPKKLVAQLDHSTER